MPSWGYEVRSITLESDDDVVTALQKAFAPYGAEGLELVSCFPAPERFTGELHQLPDPSKGSQAYDDIWNTPTGPTFIAVFKRPTGD